MFLYLYFLKSQGPWWPVLKGRKDGRVSKANETINLPSPFSNATKLVKSFAKRGLNVKDLVTLSGGHTLGFSHCSSFSARIHNSTDPTINSEFAMNLKKKCPLQNKDGNAGEFLDSTSSKFDNDYYKRITMGEGVFGSMLDSWSYSWGLILTTIIWGFHRLSIIFSLSISVLSFLV
ncbi:putative peroxidase [Helianthus annuus]|nr:putative peroxidase [Helianthus annuus]